MSANQPVAGVGAPSVQAASRPRAQYVVAAIVATALAAGAVGVLVGRATQAGGEAVAATRWRPLPAAPISGRLASAPVWTGSEMIVWGGAPRSGKIRLGAEGAAYDPAARTWRRLAPAPLGVEGLAATAWTGNELVVWASNSPDGPVGAAVYDPSTDKWRRLPAGPLGRREGYASAWTGKELLVVGGNLGDTLAKPLAAALDPRAGTWRLLPALDRFRALMPGADIAWSGREAFVLGTVCAQRLTACRPVLLAYDPMTDGLRQIGLAKAPIVPEQQLRLVGWSGTELVFSTVGVPSNVNSGRYVVVRYDPKTGRWRKGRFAPFPSTIEGVYQQTAWLGDRFVVPDGSSGLQIYDLATDRWQTITPGRSPLNSRDGSAIVWTGSELIAWSGTVFERFNPTPANGASLRLRD